MGYCMEQIKSEFAMRKEVMQQALDALKSIPDEGFSLLITDKEEILKCDNFIDAMLAFDWKLKIVENGDAIAIEFQGDKSHDDITVMSAIAPFVEKDSYIMMLGEDRTVWAWLFDGTTCEEKDYP